jgi:hypothetical protein
MWILLVAAAVAAPPTQISDRLPYSTWVTHGDIQELLDLDDALLTISKKLAEIDKAYAYIDNNNRGDNPYPWEKDPHRPTLRDRRRALRGAREAITNTITKIWVR